MDKRDIELDYLRRALLECRYQIAVLVKMLTQAINELDRATKVHDGRGSRGNQSTS